VIRTKQTVHLADLAATRAYAERDPVVVDAVELGGVRTNISVPMLKDNELIGIITIFRQEVRSFTDKQVALLTSFASQAVIAIENARLLNELRARTSELTRSVEELRALGEVSQAVNSTLDLQTVLDTIVARAAQISGTEAGAIYVFDEQRKEFQLSATFGMSEDMIAAVRNMHAEISAAVGLLTETHEPSAAGAFRRGRGRAGRAPQGAGRISGEHRRVAEDFRGAIGADDPECAPVRGDRGQEPAARGGEPAQVAVPRQYEPRAAHAVERNYRPH
jgi:GAF domain-containing protein